ncbi:MAG TPA: hypothetical protein VIF38_05090 [Burkholderiales bacterium]
MTTRTMILAACFLVGGCSTLTDYGVVRKESLRNEQGHVIGYKEMLRNEQTGEVVAQVALFTPMRNDSGDIVGYEEQTRSDVIIRDLDGHSIGSKFTDLRSRKSLTIVMRPADAPKLARAQPKLLELIASLSPSDLRRVQ